MIAKEFDYIGLISRVDFIPIGYKSGFEEYHDPLFKSAFVHFEKVYPTPTTQSIHHSIYSIDAQCQYKFIANCSQEYWYLKRVHQPIQETILNTHQIMESGRWLQKQVEDQQKQMEQQQKQMEQQQKQMEQQAMILEKQALLIENQMLQNQHQEQKLESIRHVVYQLIGGLYNHKTQKNQIELHSAHLFQQRTQSVLKRDTDNKWPTTRQGDEHEDRINALENSVNSLEESVKDMLTFGNFDTVFNNSFPFTFKLDRDDNNEICSVSSHSSMPELIDANSEDDDDDNSGSGSREKRIRNSCELCGNN
jgi:hypothetical protein